MNVLPATRAVLLTMALWQGTRCAALASGGPPPMLNPYERVSPSSEYALSVNPSDLYGRGPADYRFAKNGVTAWTNRFDFTLWDCAVADSGHVVGYAYSHGMAGFSEGGYSAGAGVFSAVILSPSGRVVLNDRMPRDWSRFSGRAPGPLAEGVIVVEAERLAVIRVSDRDINRVVEQWWVYDLENGERTATLEPVKRMEEKGGRLWVLAAEAVPSTPLILAHWWKYGDKRSGGVFTLVDRTATPIWSLS